MFTTDTSNLSNDIDKKDIIVDLFSMYAWSLETLPYKELIRMLKDQSGTSASLYEVALLVKEITDDT